MDPVAAGVGFLLGVLTAGAGALFQAQLLDGRHERALRRALVSEIRENIQALSGGKILIELHRSAWDPARAVNLRPAEFEAVAAAYIEADRHNTNNNVVTGRLASSEGGLLAAESAVAVRRSPRN